MPNLSLPGRFPGAILHHSKPIGICLLLPVLAAFLMISFPIPSSEADDLAQTAYVIPIHDMIDLGLAFFVKRSLREAQDSGAGYIVLEVNTLGGRVDAALDIRDALDNITIPSAAYVDKRAISAGALITLATKKIAMAPGSTIGAATPVGIAPGGEKLQLGEKEVSYLRGEFRATAERNGHSPVLAEAMVDADAEAFAIFKDSGPEIVSGPASSGLSEAQRKENATEVISPKGKLLTMTADEAVRVGLAESTPASLDEFLGSLGLDPVHKTTAKISWSEHIVRFLTNPIVAGLLLTLGVLGIFFELQMPGWGISGSLGTLLLVLFFGGHYLAGLANFTDVLFFVLGLVLLGLEFFVVPGFGITGISGLVCILAGIYLALVKRPLPKFSWDYRALDSAFLTFLFAVVAIPVGIVVIWKTFPDSRLRKLIVLSASERGEDGYVASESLEALVGQSGKSLSRLRPAGRALIGGEPMEVQSEGDFIEKDTPLKVVRVMGNKVFVASQEEDEASS
jgi:membrane-bound serine protease (ClpP class)